MRITLCELLFFLIWNYFAIGESPRWDLMHQDTYKIEVHRIETPWYNSTYLKIETLEYVRYNRSLPRALNASIYLYMELGRNLMMKVQLYKLLSNQYKFFPLTASIRVCQEYERNSFGLQDVIAKFTNLKLCPQKPGHLYVIRMNGNHSRLPPLIPFGDYKVSSEFTQYKDKVLNVDLFVSITSKAAVPYEK